MKKIKMNLQHLEHAEVLTRSQLKKVLGGTFGSTTHVTTTVGCPILCTSTSPSCSAPYCKCDYETGTCYAPLPGE